MNSEGGSLNNRTIGVTLKSLSCNHGDCRLEILEAKKYLGYLYFAWLNRAVVAEHR
jgi:hypothetical protein